MREILILTMMVAITCAAFSQETSKIDPNHLKDGGYGYIIHSDQNASVWWAEGAYKVMRDAPLPTNKDDEIKMWSAKNEFESFILVVKPTRRIENFRITIAELKDKRGNIIDDNNITVRKVEYVHVTRPTDSYAFTGWWPDPLPLYKQPETIFPAENQPFWITVKVPATANAGDYSGDMLLSSGDWSLSVPVKLHVWDFTLPKTPSMRSGFGFNLSEVKKYDNIKNPEQEKEAFEYYMKAFRDYKISPYNPFALTPIREDISGVAWKGGFFDNEIKYEGKYSYRIEDHSATTNIEGTSINLVPVKSGDPYKLNWVSRSPKEQDYVVGVECYNADKELIIFQNRFDLYTGQKEWKHNELDLGTFNNETKFIKIRLFPSLRTPSGEHTGTVWFDDIKLTNTNSGKNEFLAGNFEVNLDDIDITMDFTDFNKAGRRYFDDYGFTGYNLSLKGLGGGTFHSRREGVFSGFKQGTEEYNILMKRYLSQLQNNLEKSGWLGKEYIYWFDEPNEVDYPFVKETNALIKRYAPKLTTFLTEHVSGQNISDVTDISCTIWHKLNHGKIKQMNERGLEHWSYLCTWPKSPWISLFTDHDAINLRMWLWGSYKHQLKGILVWATNWWNSPNTASPEGYLQNPWEEAGSYTDGYGTPWGKQNLWGNGDGRFFYPLNREPNKDLNTYVDYPVPSLRLEILRDGIEDYEYFIKLESLINNAKGKESKTINEARKLLTIPEDIYVDEKTYSKNPQDILEYRKRIADYILTLKKM